MSDYRDLLIQGLEHERHAQEQRAEGCLLLLNLALGQLGEQQAENRRLEERYLRAVEDGRRLRVALLSEQTEVKGTLHLPDRVIGKDGKHNPTPLAAIAVRRTQQQPQERRQ